MTDDFPSVVGVEHRFVEAGGLRVHVAEAGAGEPLLLSTAGRSTGTSGAASSSAWPTPGG